MYINEYYNMLYLRVGPIRFQGIELLQSLHFYSAFP